jgi:hypothetical protein
VVATIAANANSTAWLFGRETARAAASQIQTYTIGIQNKSNVSGSNLNPTHAFGSNTKLSLMYASATASDTIVGKQMSILIRG